MSGCMRHVWSRKTPRDGVYGRRSAEEVAEGRDAGAGRVDPLDGLIELARVAEQDETRRRLADGEGVGEAHLSRLVDDEHVHRAGHLRARPQPRGASGEVRLARGERSGHLVVGHSLDDALVPRTSSGACRAGGGRTPPVAG